MIKDAAISPCGLYRYTLSRTWDEKKAHVLFILLNPSTADAELDDPTLRRGIGFAKAWNYGGVVYVNLFGFRATSPKDMKAATDPVGPLNDGFLLTEADRADKIVLAWGTHGTHLGRDKAVIKLLANCADKVYCLGRTKAGHPKHPLYLNADTPLENWACS